MFMFNYPLTDNNIYKNDLLENIKFFRKNKKNTYSVTKSWDFENKWSRSYGVKYSVFVNSGSYANLLTLLIIKILWNQRF